MHEYAFGSLTLARIRGLASDRIFRRGESYHRNGRVLALDFPAAETAEARVEGSVADPYVVRIRLEGDRPVAACTCRYGWEPFCKHAIAVLLAIRDYLDDLARRSGLAEPSGRAAPPAAPPAAEELIRARAARAADQQPEILSRPADRGPGTYRVASASGAEPYEVRIRDLPLAESSCSCPDYRLNELGTCKHIERVHADLRADPLWSVRFSGAPAAICLYHRPQPRDRPDFPVGPDIRLAFCGLGPPPGEVQRWLARHASADGSLSGLGAVDAEALHRAWSGLVEELRGLVARNSLELEVEPAAVEQIRARAEAVEWEARMARTLPGERGVPAGPEWQRMIRSVRARLRPYQREGVAYLARVRRGILADALGADLSVQAVALDRLLREMGEVARSLVLAPACAISQWSVDIHRLLGSDAARPHLRGEFDRAPLHGAAATLMLVSFEELARDRDLLRAAGPDLVVVDDAQRLADWDSPAWQALAAVGAPYLALLAGLGVSRQLRQLCALAELTQPRWVRTVRRLLPDSDARGSPQPTPVPDAWLGAVMLRRSWEELSGQVEAPPERVLQIAAPAGHQRQTRALAQALDRVLSEQPPQPERVKAAWHTLRLTAAGGLLGEPREFDRLLREPAARGWDGAEWARRARAPKLALLAAVIDQLLGEPGRKALVFAHWRQSAQLAERSLRATCRRHRAIALLLHSGLTVGQRAAVARRFARDGSARVLVATDGTVTGLDLAGVAGVAVHLDLPLAPAQAGSRVSALRREGMAPVVVLYLLDNLWVDESIGRNWASGHSLFRALYEPRRRSALAPPLDLARLSHLLNPSPASAPVPVLEPPRQERPAPGARRASLKELMARLAADGLSDELTAERGTDGCWRLILPEGVEPEGPA